MAKKRIKGEYHELTREELDKIQETMSKIPIGAIRWYIQNNYTIYKECLKRAKKKLLEKRGN